MKATDEYFAMRSITRDEEIYPDPEEFRPERFENEKVLDPREVVFGFGRRYVSSHSLKLHSLPVRTPPNLRSSN